MQQFQITLDLDFRKLQITYYFIISIPFRFQNSSQNGSFFCILLIALNILFSLTPLYSLENKTQYSY